MSDREVADFAAYHQAALIRDEVKHGLILNALARPPVDRPGDLLCWTLGEPGRCAIKMSPFAIVLGSLDRVQCHRCAELTAEIDYPGVVGPDDTAVWFVERATELGLVFGEPIPQQIHSLSEAPHYPNAPGSVRRTTVDDLPLLANWVAAFFREAVPHDPPPDVPAIAWLAGGGDFQLWIDDGHPVSMAGIVRRLANSAAITGVYTPPEWRGRGYAGSVTAATVERIHAEGRTTACLYTDLRNPFSNRCYHKIGFRPVCRSMHFARREPDQRRAPA
jgi:RimJ/RimL family protein N-acetyltransferase